MLLLIGPTGLVRSQQISPVPGAFVEIGIGAAEAARGFTGSTSSLGAAALNWNPAGIYPEAGAETSFSFVDQLELVEYGRFSLSIPLWENKNAIALSVQVSGDDALLEESISVGYAHRVRFFWFGVSSSYHRAVFGRNALKASDYTVFSPDEVAEGIGRQVSGRATGFGINAGMKLMLTDGVVLGVMARNITAPLSWSSLSDARPGEHNYTESLPIEVATGVEYHMNDKLAGSIEWIPVMENGSISRIGFGSEFNPVKILAIRAGRMVFQDGFANEINTFGFGFKMPKSVGINLKADYAFISGRIAKSQQISLTIAL